ncbi:MAG: hypothetical protein RL536_49, partial [Candidatus Parcubacteria bacterium]
DGIPIALTCSLLFGHVNKWLKFKMKSYLEK